MKESLHKIGVFLLRSKCFVIATTFACGQSPLPPAATTQDLITCGWDEVSAIRLEGSNVTPLWTWKAANSNLPEWCKPLFSTTSDCKPYSDGSVLVTSSGGNSLDGAVALISPYAPATSNVVFYARAPNAHSADLLPGNRVAVAMSYHASGNRMAVFDLANPNVEILSVPLYGAHGVVWDPTRQVLWGMADTYLRKYQLLDWETQPKLRLISTYNLPAIGGHEMSAVRNSPNLTISTGSNTWLFNRDTQLFVQHPLLGNLSNVKCIDTHPFTGRIVYVQANTHWWTESLRFVSPDLTTRFSGAHFYKARWITPTHAPSGCDSGGGAISGAVHHNDFSIGGSYATLTTQAGTTQNHSGLIEVIYPLAPSSLTGSDEYDLPDDWQIQNFGAIGVDPAADADFDGTSNLLEYLAGTNPNRASSVFRPQGTYSGGLFQMPVSTVAGRNYQIWISRDLQSWTRQSSLIGDDTTQLFTFDETTIPSGPLQSSSHPSHYFFRVQILTP